MYHKLAPGLGLVMALLLAACSPLAPQTSLQITAAPVMVDPVPPPPTPSQPATVGLSNAIGQRTKTSNCISKNGSPDPACTPGAIFSGATKDQVCTSGYSSQVRNVPESEKIQVYSEYGIPSHSPGQYEVDHFISLELGGSNDIANLWPEPAEPRPGFHEKDKLENYLHSQVCSGVISLQEAQAEIANNWLQVYQSIPNK